MTKFSTLLASAALGGLFAAPALALELGADAMLGATPEDTTTLKMIEDSAFIDNEVRTLDQKVIGLVKGVSEDADGNQMVLVELSSDVAAQSSVKDFTVMMPKDTAADGSLTLGWNESDLFIALSSQK